MENEERDHLPIGHGLWAWVKAATVLAILVLINIVSFAVSFGWGVIITIPLTLVMAFLMLRDILPRHRLPPGRPPQGMLG